MNLSQLRSGKEVLNEHMKDPEFRERWEKTALARAVALRLVAYRVEHDLSQTDLAKMLGMKQPAIARLEAGEKNPTWETLVRLSESLGIEFVVDIVPGRRKSMVGAGIDKAEVLERLTTRRGRVVIAAS